MSVSWKSVYNHDERPKSSRASRQRNRPQLYEEWVNAIYRRNRYPTDKCQQNKSRIRWVVIYPVDGVIHLSTNQGQVF